MTPTTSAAKLLIVEDEALIAAEITDRLGRLGYEVVGDCASAAAACRAARDLQPDLVLMDIQLQGDGDGIEAAEQIYRSLSIPVVYLTAHSDDATVDRARGSLPFGYLLKPPQEKELAIAIEMALERHGIECRLRESEARFSATLNSLTEGVVAADSALRITYLNPVAEELSGWTADDAQARPIGECFRIRNGQTGVEPRHPLAEALRRRAAVCSTVPLVLCDRHGETIPIKQTAAPIVTTNCEVIGAVMVLRDCRDEQRAEAALSTARAQLNAALRMEAVGRLAGGVAHDFNNMLTVILGCCQVLEQDLEDPASARLVREISDAGRRASALTDQLLSVGKSRVSQREPVDLNATLERIDSLLRRVAGSKVDFEVVPAPEPLVVEADGELLTQVLVNLVANARDATRRLGATVRVAVSLDDADDANSNRPSAVIRVIDEGEGIADHDLPHIFEPFFTTKKPGRGIGLGLASAYGTIVQFGGRIDVKSRVGHGTSFEIRLPLIEGPSEVRERDLPEDVSASGGERILLVEDDPLVRRTAEFGLEAFGYEIDSVPNARMALERFERGERYDLLLSDVGLPGMNGRELADRVHELDPDLPVVLVSGFNEDPLLREGVQEARYEFLPKPFSPIELARKLRWVLDRDSERSAPGES